MSEWIHALTTMQGKGLSAVLVSVASIKGSAPREPGAKMVVAADEIAGTIGGGHLEFKSIEIARDMLANGGEAALHRFPLGASLGQCCGGLVNLLFDPIPAHAQWLTTLATLRSAGKPCLVVTPVRGNVDEQRLIVTADECFGTLGDATHDEQAVGIARRLLAHGEPAQLASIAGAKPATAVEQFFFDPLRPPEFHIVLFGAGHVGRGVVKVLADLPCRITWVDTRDDQFPGEVAPNVSCVATGTPEAEVSAAPAGAYFLVMTHSHPLDQALAEHILARTDFAYFGLIGSISKRRQFERRMECRGIPASRFTAMTCPIGVAGISGKEPAAIAIAVAAELLQVRDRRSAQIREPAQALRA
jgi:xanthine dehydrogenase accessory factor